MVAEHTRRRILELCGGAATVGVTGLAGCIGNGVSQTQEVEITADGFDPKNVRTDQEEPLFWHNTDDVVHTVTSASFNWDFDMELEPGEATSYKFDQNGVYEVVCSEHGSAEDFTGERMKIVSGDNEEIEELVED